MGSIPLPALDVRPPQQQESPLQSYGQLLQLQNTMQNAPLQRQALQQQVQLGQQQVQMGQQNLQARQALNQAFAGSVTKDPNTGKSSFDPDKMQNALATGPAAYQTPEVMENLTKWQTARVGLQNAGADLQAKLADLRGSSAAAIKAANYDPTVAHAMLDGMLSDPSQANSPQAQQMRAIVDNPQMLKQWVDTQIAQSPKQQTLQNEKDVAGIRSNTPEMQAQNAWIAANTKPGQPVPTADDYKQAVLNRQTQAHVGEQVQLATNPQIQQGKVQVAAAEGAARANTDAQIARGSDAALAQVPPHLVAPATAAATKAGEDYAQAQSVTQTLQQMLDAAKSGNVVSYQLIPQEGALQITTSQGVHRINMAEIQNYGGGSWLQRLQGHVGKALTGQSIPSSVLNDMADMQAVMQRGSQAKYENDLNTINQTYGAKFKPIQPTQVNPPTGSPTPQTHTFSLSAWQRANPNGDVNAAKAAAQQQGYQVIQ